MECAHRWRNLLNLRNSVSFSSTQFASFHSTCVCHEKWKRKWNSDFKRGQPPSKNYARYVIREKRADAKRALRSLLFNCENLRTGFQNEDINNSWNNSTKKVHQKSQSQHAQKIHNHRKRRKLRKGLFSEDDNDYPENIFHATCGNRWYTWSFNSWTRSSQSSTTGFEWRETFHHRENDHEEQEDGCETGCAYETFNVGSRSDREILGLPLKGFLKKEDVKNAFHLSALKWHPDKHQGSSQGAAEEKFKQCVNAYRSLCNALSAT